MGTGSALTFFELQLAWLREERLREAAHQALVDEALRAQPPLRVRVAGRLRALARFIDPQPGVVPEVWLRRAEVSPDVRGGSQAGCGLTGLEFDERATTANSGSLAGAGGLRSSVVIAVQLPASRR
jgi:hypothetical protein